MLTAAVFDIRQQDILTASPINPFFSVQADAVRVTSQNIPGRSCISSSGTATIRTRIS
jgi:hypothetical protein